MKREIEQFHVAILSSRLAASIIIIDEFEMLRRTDEDDGDCGENVI